LAVAPLELTIVEEVFVLMVAIGRGKPRRSGWEALHFYHELTEKTFFCAGLEPALELKKASLLQAGHWGELPLRFKNRTSHTTAHSSRDDKADLTNRVPEPCHQERAEARPVHNAHMLVKEGRQVVIGM
jgi:hypothetical protein